MTKTESLERIVYLLAFRVEGHPAYEGLIPLLGRARDAVRRQDVKSAEAEIIRLEREIDAIGPVLPVEDEPLAWYVVRVAGGREKHVRRHLEHEFSDRKRMFYLPVEIRDIRIARRKAKGVERALIPSYLFAHVAASDIHRFRKVVGVHGLLSERGPDGPVPRPAPAMFVASLALAEAFGAFDHTAPEKPEVKGKKGERIKITSGPFTGAVGAIATAKKGAKRVKIMLDTLGKIWGGEMEIDLDQLQPERIAAE